MKIKLRGPVVPARVPRSAPFPIAGIGASAGGLEAFSELLRHLPVKTGMAFVLVQHLDPKHSSELKDILSRTTKIPVIDATDRLAVQPDHIYVMPPNASMTIRDGILRLSPRVLTRGRNLPIDHFLRSLAEDRGNGAISVILSGTASDGTEGSRAIKVAGGITFAQDEKSAKYASMPHSARIAGGVDFILPPPAIAQELLRLAQHPYLAPVPAQRADIAIVPGGEMEVLLSLLREATGVDFTYYKHTSLHRRIQRRILLHKLQNLKDYVRFVRNTPGEIEELYQDILIHVTSFFRDPAVFEALRKRVFPDLFRASDRGTIRVWVPGCSTGEEVYSLAMAMLEYIWLETQRTVRPPLGSMPFQVFATDISDNSLDRARAGLYSEAAVADISPERLNRFFNKIDGGYQINKSVRELCIFAKQNVAKDPPFSNLDLISCRNLLIYLAPILQERVIPTLHYALRPSGYLLLGGSESLAAFAAHFTQVDKKSKIYQKKKTATRLITYFGGGADHSRARTLAAKTTFEPRPVSIVEREADRVLFHRFVPASIVVNDEMEIVQFRGKTGKYLEPPAGQPSFNLSKMAREGLLMDLRAALLKAKKQSAPVRKDGVRIRLNGDTSEVNLEVIPIRGQMTERFYVVVFQDAAKVAPSKDRGGLRKASPPKDPSARENQRLQIELTQVREQLQSLVEDHEATSEEFRAANEEISSANEELQSTSEEMETAKEELQSSNEELTTLNEEMQNRNVELSVVNNDLRNLLDNVSIPVVIVGNDLHIRRFTPPAETLLNLRASDVGRRLNDIRPNLDVDDLGEIARETIESAISQEIEVRDSQGGGWNLMRVRPYTTSENKIDGAVISFQDIDVMKRSLDLIRVHADALIENAREAILVLDSQLRVMNANLVFYRDFEVSREETEKRPIYDLGDGQWNIPRLRELLEKILPNNGRVEDFEVRHDFPHLGPRVMMLNARRIEPQPGRQLILIYIEDVTRKRA